MDFETNNEVKLVVSANTRKKNNKLFIVAMTEKVELVEDVCIIIMEIYILL